MPKKKIAPKKQADDIEIIEVKEGVTVNLQIRIDSVEAELFKLKASELKASHGDYLFSLYSFAEDHPDLFAKWYLAQQQEALRVRLNLDALAQKIRNGKFKA